MEKKKTIDTFQRVEDKYRLTPAQADILLENIRCHVEPDAYFRYTVHSIYYDTENCDLAVSGLEHPEYKFKLRVRGYNIVHDTDKVFLETKKKYGNIVYKKRFALTASEAIDYLEYGIPHSDTSNTAQEIDYRMKQGNLQAKTLITYDRECYAATEEDDVRITFDRNIRYRLDDLTDFNDRGTERSLNGGWVMLEVKAMDRYPVWLVQALSEMKLYRTSFSKYSSIYKDNFAAMSVNGRLRIQETEKIYTKETKLCSLQY